MDNPLKLNALSKRMPFPDWKSCSSKVFRCYADDVKKHSFWALLLTLFSELFLISGVLNALSRSINKNNKRKQWGCHFPALIFCFFNLETSRRVWNPVFLVNSAENRNGQCTQVWLVEEFMEPSAVDFFLFANWRKNMYVLQSSYIDQEKSEKDSFSN